MGLLEVAFMVSSCGGIIALHEYVMYREDVDESDRYDEADQYED